jgi:hypothetical protein
MGSNPIVVSGEDRCLPGLITLCRRFESYLRQSGSYCLGQMAERSIAMVLKTIGCEPQGFKSPFAQKQYLRDGMVDVMDLKSMAIACGFKSHRRYAVVAEW